MIQRFREKNFIPALTNAIAETEKIYQSQNQLQSLHFLQQFRMVCTQLNKHTAVTDFTLSFFYFHLLRTQFIYHDYRYAAYAYDESFYLKEGITCGMIDLSFLFQPYDHLWQEMIKESRLYIGSISIDEVQALMLAAIPHFHCYAVAFLRLQLGKAIETEEYQSLPRSHEVEIASGELLEPCDLLYIENNKKQLRRVHQQIQNAPRGALQFRDFRGLKLSDLSLNHQDFRYADFSDAQLNHTKFYSSLLDGVSMRRSQAKGANFILAMLNDTDFTNADLQGSQFGFCISDSTKNSQNGWRGVGCIGSSFVQANLQDANFRHSLIVGGDFQGANLQGISFQEAALFGSRFNETQIWEGMLSPLQREQIQLV